MKRVIFSILLVFLSSCLLSQENTAILCSDGIDNDNDGQIDCDDQECMSIPNEGCATCTDGLSFADVVLEYQSGCPQIDPNPEGALGVSDYWGNNADELEFVFLGQGGFLKLGFTNNRLSNSGDNSSDLFVFEIGPNVEGLSISLRPENQSTREALINNNLQDPDSDGYYFITNIGGSTSFVDLDAFITGYGPSELFFDAVEVKDLIDESCGGTTPGADIDAVCAIYSVDCNNVQFGTATLDECGECLEPTDPLFNESCKDCNGIPNGGAIIDDCGECNVPDTELYNQSCIDCLNVIDGTAILDDCGNCLEPDDPFFNQGCVSCDIFIPNVFTPNSNDANALFKPYTCPESSDRVEDFLIYDRWGNLIFRMSDYQIIDPSFYWDGTSNGHPLNPAVFVYSITVLNFFGESSTYKGNVTLIR